MNKEKIEQALKTTWAARDLEFYPVIDSTNNVAKAAGLDGRDSGFMAVADRQDAGRGSRGRSWVSPAGHNVFMSLMVRPGIPMDKAAGLTLVMALSIAEGIEEMIAGETGGDTFTGIKWPNDIVINKRKVCGILTELHMMPDQTGYFVVIGVGINVNQPAELFPDEIKDTAGSIFTETGDMTDRSGLIAACMARFEHNYEKYVMTQSMAALRSEYEKRLINRGKEVRILDPKGEYEAIAGGISDEGALLIELPDGSREKINAGEVSVRGLYGYV